MDSPSRIRMATNTKAKFTTTHAANTTRRGAIAKDGPTRNALATREPVHAIAADETALPRIGNGPRHTNDADEVMPTRVALRGFISSAAAPVAIPLRLKRPGRCGLAGHLAP